MPPRGVPKDFWICAVVLESQPKVLLNISMSSRQPVLMEYCKGIVGYMELRDTLVRCVIKWSKGAGVNFHFRDTDVYSTASDQNSLQGAPLGVKWSHGWMSGVSHESLNFTPLTHPTPPCIHPQGTGCSLIRIQFINLTDPVTVFQ